MNEQIKSALEKHGLTVESVFVPFSKSRNAGNDTPSLNWRVTLKRNGRAVLTTDYSAGCGHAPFYKKIKNTMRMTQWEHAELMRECETGYPVTRAAMGAPMGLALQGRKSPILPDPADVVYSMLTDSEVIDYSSFEDWAGNFGYDPDSRAGERIYNDCMKIALQFRTIGESAIAELREVFQDY